MKIELLTKDSLYFDEILNIYYNWWGKDKNKTLNDIKNDYKDYGTEPYPSIYILTENNNLIGVYEINEHDDLNTDLKPFFANLYIKEEYRHNGYSKLLIEDAKKRYNPLYLHSRLNNYYEKFGFQYIGDINSIYGTKRVYQYQKQN